MVVGNCRRRSVKAVFAPVGRYRTRLHCRRHLPCYCRYKVQAVSLTRNQVIVGLQRRYCGTVVIKPQEIAANSGSVVGLRNTFVRYYAVVTTVQSRGLSSGLNANIHA